jgi:hypothetical protein
MKKAAVPTTAARGAAVSSRRRTAVQSVYIPAGETVSIIPAPGTTARRGLQRVVSQAVADAGWGSRPIRSYLTLP